jgi:hypothetical protein
MKGARRIPAEILGVDGLGRTVIEESAVNPGAPTGNDMGATVFPGRGHPVMIRLHEPGLNFIPGEEVIVGFRYSVSVRQLRPAAIGSAHPEIIGA